MMVQQKLEDELSKLPDGWIMLVETTAESSMEVTLTALNLLTEKGYKGIIISASRPYKNLMGIYSQRGVKTKNLYFIDCISKAFGASEDPAGNVVFVDNVASLTDLSVAVNNMIREIGGKKFIFIDSITTMLIHNKPDVFVKFMHSILTKMRVHMISGFLISLETEMDSSIKIEIMQLCDKVIKVGVP